jgi:DNA-binding response OmpR family regulator
MISKIFGPKVLLVEKNNHLFDILSSCSIYHHIQVERLLSLNDLLTTISGKYILLILDVNLTRESNHSIIRAIRRNYPLLPIIVIGPDSSPQEIISYRLGINIYHRKPLNCDLLKVQILQLTTFFHTNMNLEIGDIRIDTVNQSFFIKNKRIIFTYQEFNLIILLLRSEGHILSREKICNSFAGSHKDLSNAAIDTLISRIRSKLKPYLKERFIKTEYKLGYRINPRYLDDR